MTTRTPFYVMSAIVIIREFQNALVFSIAIAFTVFGANERGRPTYS